MTKEIEDLLSRHKALKAERRHWEQHWQELAEVMLPRRAEFTTTPVPGDKRTSQIYDGTPMQARRSLATTVHGLLTPRASPWFFLKAADEALNRDDEVKLWLEDAERRLRAAIYDRRTHFVQRASEMYNDLVTFGTGLMFIGEGKSLNRLLFRSFHLKDVVVAENVDGEVDSFFVEEILTARQAAQRFGEARLGEKTREALRDDKPDRSFKFLWAVQPREERDPRGRDNRNLPFASVQIDVESDHIIDESGFNEFPMAVPRWDTASGELYGRSPGMIALPDALTLQQQGKTILIAGQKEVDPPIFAASDSLMSAPRTWPGGVTYFDAEAARELGGRLPFEPLRTGANIPIGREMQNDTRGQVERAFFKNVFNLPVEGPQMTATEVLERKEEFLREVGPTLGHLEDDGPAAIVERAFNILLRAGVFAAPPPQLADAGVSFRFESTVERVSKQIEAAGMSRSFELLGPLMQAQPDILDNFDGDVITRDTPEIFGIPGKWLRTREQVSEMREQRGQAQQAEALLQNAEAGSGIIERFAKAASLPKNA